MNYVFNAQRIFLHLRSDVYYWEDDKFSKHVKHAPTNDLFFIETRIPGPDVLNIWIVDTLVVIRGKKEQKLEGVSPSTNSYLECNHSAIFYVFSAVFCNYHSSLPGRNFSKPCAREERLAVLDVS